MFRKLTPYLFLCPAMLIIGIFVLLPMASALVISFSDYNMIEAHRFAGLDQYRRLLKDPFFWNALYNSLLYLLVVVPVLSFAPVFLAALVNRKLPGIAVFRGIYYLPVVTSLVVTGLMWKWVYEENGVLNFILRNLGLMSEPIAWLATPSVSLFAVMAVTVWSGMGFYMVIYLAGLQSIPKALYEVAELQGVSRIRQTLFITIPMLRPYIALVAVISSIAAMKVFDEVFIMTGGGPLGQTETLVFFVYQNAFIEFDMGYASAAGMALFAATFALSVLNLMLARDSGYAKR
ncbi:MAG: sugar ABC transporter permease [Gammaproteobacteria bacterium]|nr:sugar ABC transporter permease [Gammaproteobacteria bacterium]MCY4165679.1 sugar ABC transporter permease [Gammaproteobacteria bacterium]MCY4341383.1 sugar ABC transporter permease [Gammaproteobacteria bacterium]